MLLVVLLVVCVHTHVTKCVFFYYSVSAPCSGNVFHLPPTEYLKNHGTVLQSNEASMSSEARPKTERQLTEHKVSRCRGSHLGCHGRINHPSRGC